MVGEEQKDVIVFGGLEDFTASFSSDCGFVSFQDVQEDGRVDTGSFVIDNNTSINVNTWVRVGGFVEDFALEGVLDVVSNIIICEGNDAFGGESIFLEDLVGVENVGLVSVVGPGVGASDQDGPVVAKGDTRETK